MNCRKWYGLVGLLVILPAGARAQVRQQTAVEQARAQALLDAQARVASGKTGLPPEKEQLRGYMTIARDSFTATDAVAERLQRAERAHSAGVVIATARALRVECARTDRTIARMLEPIKALHTTDPLGDRALDAYRTALDDVQRTAQECSRLVVGSVASEADQDRFGSIAVQLSKTIDRYTGAQTSLMRVLEIPFLPKNYVDPLGG